MQRDFPVEKMLLHLTFFATSIEAGAEMSCFFSSKMGFLLKIGAKTVSVETHLYAVRCSMQLLYGPVNKERHRTLDIRNSRVEF